MIQFQCPECGKGVRARDEHAGKRMRCPGCMAVVTLPAPSTSIAPAKPPVKKSAPPPVQDEEEPILLVEARHEREPDDDDERPRRARRRARDDDEDDDRPRRRSRAAEDDDEAEDDDDRPRRRKKSVRRRGLYVDCPHCGSANSTRVGWTLWGGMLGSWLLTHVRCNRCGTTFNGNTGKSNNTAIAIYIGVSLAIGLAIGACSIIAAILGHR